MTRTGEAGSDGGRRLDLEQVIDDLLSGLAEPLNAARTAGQWRSAVLGNNVPAGVLFSSRRAATIKAPARESWQFLGRPPWAAKPFAVGVIVHLKNRPHRQLEKQVRQGRRETPPRDARVNMAVSGLLLV